MVLYVRKYDIRPGNAEEFVSNEDIQKLGEEARTYITNMSRELWGPSPIIPEPIRPGQ